MNKSQYLVYLQSEDWKLKRQLCFERYGRACAVCGERRGVEVHHLNYRNIFDVKASDLRPLCGDHHDKVHALLKANDEAGSLRWKKCRTGYQRFKTIKKLLQHEIRKAR